MVLVTLDPNPTQSVEEWTAGAFDCITDAIDSDVDKLLRVNIMSLTDEMVRELSKEIKSAQAERTFWSKETPKNQFTTDLEGL